jgi:predicted transcriptional regulator/predicted hydrocarbon binding protein
MFSSVEVQKAYELCYAIFRVAALVERSDLKERLERLAASLLERVSSGELEVRKNTESLRAIIMIADGIGEIRHINSKVLLREIGRLEQMLEEIKASRTNACEFDIEKMFSEASSFVKEEIKNTIRSVQERKKADLQNESGRRIPNNSEIDRGVAKENRQNMTMHLDSATRQTNSATPQEKNSQGVINNLSSEERLMAIYRRIQRGNASLKDLFAEFGSSGSQPSERTLRYDLQRLVEEGKIVRIGNGGPGTYYSLPEKDTVQQLDSNKVPQTA